MISMIALWVLSGHIYNHDSNMTYCFYEAPDVAYTKVVSYSGEIVCPITEEI